MTKIVGVRFRSAGKIYYFDPVDFDLDMAMHVIVETARGVEMGTVLIPPKEIEDDQVVSPLKAVIRVATEEDEETVAKNKEKEREAFAICKEKIIKHELAMKLVDAEYTFDGNKLLFYFTADGRVDFRELVKDLASVFRTRIELRQIGVRDETKMMGGLGICGRELCCKSYMADFLPVSIKMAKEQSLSLNPTKISGVCGRLMCCLKYEQDTYEYLNSRLPNVGEKIMTPEGIMGEVKSVSVLRQLVKVIIDNGEEKELREYTIEDLRLKPRQKRDVKLTDEELKEIGDLEDTSGESMDGDEEQPSDRRRSKGRKQTNYNDRRRNASFGNENRSNENRGNENRSHENRGNESRGNENRGERNQSQNIESVLEGTGYKKKSADSGEKKYPKGPKNNKSGKFNKNRNNKNKEYKRDHNKSYKRNYDNGDNE